MVRGPYKCEFDQHCLRTEVTVEPLDNVRCAALWKSTLVAQTHVHRLNHLVGATPVQASRLNCTKRDNRETTLRRHISAYTFAMHIQNVLFSIPGAAQMPAVVPFPRLLVLRCASLVRPSTLTKLTRQLSRHLLIVAHTRPCSRTTGFRSTGAPRCIGLGELSRQCGVLVVRR